MGPPRQFPYWHGASGDDRRQLRTWSEREAQALGRWDRYGVPEARSLDGQIADSEKTVSELGRRRDRQERTLDGFQLDRTKSRLRDHGRGMYALRERLDGIEPASVSEDRVERSLLRVPGGLGHDNYRGISRDLGHGLGR